MVHLFVCSTADTDVLPEWREVGFPPAIKRIVSQVSNRIFVGPSLCKLIVSIIPVNLRELTFYRPESGVAGPQCRPHDNSHEMGHVHEPIPQLYSTV